MAAADDGPAEDRLPDDGPSDESGRRWLVTGGTGMLAQDLVAQLRQAGAHVTAAGHAECDITSADDCREAVAGVDVVVNAAAWAAVDDAEAQEPAAFAVNAAGAANLARACTATGARLVHLSTDYVFDGGGHTPYPEGHPVAPRSAYGRTKAAGEWAVRAECPQSWVVRTAWLYGAHGPSFVRTMARLAAASPDPVQVVTDQRGQPTWTVDLAAAIRSLVGTGAPFGTYHATSTGEATWYDVAREVFAHLGHDIERVQPTTTAAFPRPAQRPAYSVLGHDAWQQAGLAPLRPWREALHDALPSVVAGLRSP